MLSNSIINQIKIDDGKFKNGRISYQVPDFNPTYGYKDVSNNDYYRAIIVLRHYIKVVSDYYFGIEIGAKNVDLFMFTSSVSSPIGTGSDSKPISFKLGKNETFLVDSSQFGFEPLLQNNFNQLYCYLPSMRGEDCDNRHLSQFYHCEMEIIGDLQKLIPIIEGYIKILALTLLQMENIVNKISLNPKKSRAYLKSVINAKNFPIFSLDEVINLLDKKNNKKFVRNTKNGRDLCAIGEIEFLNILKSKVPVWVTNFDRDRVPFYQKPDPKNPEKTINADLLFPQIGKNSFGGEVVGAGQRQDNPTEMYQSLKRQGISSRPYEWYIDLRRQKNYKATAGFGLGIERFIAWALGRKKIQDVILYPRIKNTRSTP